MQGQGKYLIIAGCVLIIAGLLFTYGSKVPFLGKLPGDFLVKKENFTFYFPLVTSLLLSLLFSLVMYFIRR